MAVLSNWRNTLNDLGKSHHDERAGLQVFTSLNVERIAEDQELLAHGEKRGSENLPPIGSSGFDVIETAIFNRVNEHIRSQLEAFRSQQATYKARLAQIDLVSSAHVAMAKAPSIEKFSAEKERGIDSLFAIGELVNETRRERSEFREANNIKRVARLPSLGKRVLSFGVLLFLFLIEMLLNGSFLAEGNSLGLLGGTSLAAGFAFVNIFVAWMSAFYFGRQLLRRSIIWKFVGLIGTASYLAFAGCLNLALAHYREVSSSNSDDIGNLVLQRLQLSTFELTDINSMLLFAIGFGFSLIAFIDGWLWTDPYPGYSGVEARYVDAIEEYEDIRSQNIDELETIFEDTQETAQAALHSLDVARSETITVLNSYDNLRNSYREFQDQLEMDANGLLQIYREANIKSRSEPPPQHFSNRYNIKPYEPVELIPKEHLDANFAQVAKAKEKINLAIASVESAYRQAINVYPTLESTIKDVSSKT